MYLGCCNFIFSQTYLENSGYSHLMLHSLRRVFIDSLHNCIELKIEKIFRKNQNSFWRNQSMTSQILKGVHAKNLKATILFVDFSKAFNAIHRGKIKQILLAYGLPKETMAAIMMLYKNTKVKVHSLDGDRLIWHCSRCASRRHISPIPVYHLPRLRA